MKKLIPIFLPMILLLFACEPETTVSPGSPMQSEYAFSIDYSVDNLYSVCAGIPVRMINAQPADSFKWGSPTQEVWNNEFLFTPDTARESTPITLDTWSNGQYNSQTIRIFLVPPPKLFPMYFPDGGWGFWDSMTLPNGPTCLQEFHLRVYDPNNQNKLIFETDDPQFEWDFFVNGKALPMGHYDYLMEYTEWAGQTHLVRDGFDLSF